MNSDIGTNLGELIDKLDLSITALRPGKLAEIGEVEIPVADGKILMFGDPMNAACNLRNQLYTKIGELYCSRDCSASKLGELRDAVRWLEDNIIDK